MATKTTTALPLGWWRYRWPLLRAQIRAWLRRLDIDPWLVLSGIVVAAIVVYGRSSAPPAAPVQIQETPRPIVIMATVVVVATAAPLPTLAPPTAVPTEAPPPEVAPVEQPAAVDPAPAVQLAAPTVAPPPTPEPLGEHGSRPSNRPGPGERKKTTP